MYKYITGNELSNAHSAATDVAALNCVLVYPPIWKNRKEYIVEKTVQKSKISNTPTNTQTQPPIITPVTPEISVKTPVDPKTNSNTIYLNDDEVDDENPVNDDPEETVEQVLREHELDDYHLQASLDDININDNRNDSKTTSIEGHHLNTSFKGVSDLPQFFYRKAQK